MVTADTRLRARRHREGQDGVSFFTSALARVRAAASRPPRPKASAAARAPPTTTEPKASVMIESAIPMYFRPIATNKAIVAYRTTVEVEIGRASCRDRE